MASIARALSVTRRGLCRQIHTSPSTNPSPSNPLLAKLLRESDSGVKIALDSEQNLTPKSDASFWEPLITSLRSSSPRKAQLVLEWKLEKLLKEGVRDYEHYCRLISFCGDIDNIPLAMRIFASMESHGIRPNACIFNSLISACLSTGNVVMALSLFEIMDGSEDCTPNLATFNSFVSMYSKLRDGEGMMGWYLAGKKAGFSPDIQTYEFLITGFIRLEKFDEADTYYNEMLTSEILPNLAILESMLEGLCKQKNLSGIKEFLKFVLDGGWELNETMAEKLLGLYHELGSIDEMEELLGLLKPSLHLGLLPRVHCHIIRLYALSDRLDEVEYSVGRMLKGGFLFTSPESVEAVICSYFRQKAYKRLDLFLERICDSYHLTRSTYDLLVAGYRRAELYERLNLVIQDMKRVGFV